VFRVIEPLAAAAAHDAGLMSAIADLVNRVYEDSERGLWADGEARTGVDEVVKLVRAGELVIATHDSRLTGVVRVQQLDGDTAEFAMLAADPDLRGQGIGRGLVRYAEDAARARGHRYMQLELLVPRDWVLDSKEFLAAWYDRLGYRLQRVGRFEEFYPEAAPLLATPADFRIYSKTL
jgi:GNAT superfamily N-acetyltransferase